MVIKGFVLLLLAYGTMKYIMYAEDPKAPVLKRDQYWGPNPRRKFTANIRPFKINVSKEVIEDLNMRLKNTHSLRKPLEGVGWTYGVDTQYLIAILYYWKMNYDWSKRQNLLNRYSQFKTNIQGLNIHFYHVKPILPSNRSVRVLPLLLVHGWPGSIVEFQKIFPMLTKPNPSYDFVFEVIAPSLPGYGFSDAAARPGLGSAEIAVIMKNLMSRLGFKKFYTQGGDAGSVINSHLGALYPESILGIHSNMCIHNTFTSIFWTVLGSYFPFLVDNIAHWSKMYPLSHHWSRLIEESGYFHLQATKPDTVGIALTDSPAGLAAYILEKFSTWTNPENRLSNDGNLLEKFTITELLDNIMVYWVTNSITTSVRLYAESFSTSQRNLNLDMVPVHTPIACAVFPHEIMYHPKTILRYKYSNIIQMNYMPRGGHFAALEEPKLLADDLWSFVSLVEAKRAVKNDKESWEF